MEVKIQPKNFPTMNVGKWNQLKRECIAYMAHFADNQYSEDNIENFEYAVLTVAMELVYGVDYGKEIVRLQTEQDNKYRQENLEDRKRDLRKELDELEGK